MKQLLLFIKDLIKRGLVRIFPLPIQVAYIALVLTSILLIGCATPKQVTQLVRDTRVDTLYLSNVQYDSIYIYKDRLLDRSKDTIYIKDVSIEYRYKMLRDTIYKTQIDSIPFQVTVVETKEITRPLTAYDKACRITFWLVVGFLLSVIVLKLKSVFKR